MIRNAAADDDDDDITEPDNYLVFLVEKKKCFKVLYGENDVGGDYSKFLKECCG